MDGKKAALAHLLLFSIPRMGCMLIKTSLYLKKLSFDKNVYSTQILEMPLVSLSPFLCLCAFVGIFVFYSVQSNRWVCIVCFLYHSCIPNMTRVREGPAGGIKHHHLSSTHRHPQLTWNTHITHIYQLFLNTLSQPCGLPLPVFTLLGGQEKYTKCNSFGWKPSNSKLFFIWLAAPRLRLTVLPTLLF